MGLAAIKAQSRQMTSPSALLTAVDSAPYIRSSLQAFAANDPVQEEQDLDINPDIRPKDVLRIRTHRIVDKYETEEEKQEAERQENGGLTNLELHEAVALAINSIYYPTPDPYLSVEQSSYKIIVPPDYTAGTKFAGSDGKNYTPILDESGKVAYFDTGASCVMNKGGLSATTPPMVNDDLIDKSQAYNITYKVDAQGNETRRSAEDANFQLAMTRMDNQYTKLPYQLDMVDRITAEVSGATTFKSAAPSGIKTDAKPAEPFTSAVTATDAAPAATKSIMFKAREPLPWDKKTVAATAPTLEPSF